MPSDSNFNIDPPFPRMILRTLSPLVYLAVRTDKNDMLRLVWLLYLADKYRLLSYGETITGDSHVFTTAGPSGRIAMSLMNLWPQVYEAYHEQLTSDLSMADLLGHTDAEALDFALSAFGPLTTVQLSEYVRSLPECAQAGGKDSGDTGVRTISQAEMLLHPDGDTYFVVPLAHLKERQAWTTGRSGCR